MISFKRKIRRAAARARVFYEWGGVSEMSLELIRTALFRPREVVRAKRWKSHKRKLAGATPVVSLGSASFYLDPDDQGISAELALEGVHEPFATRVLLEQVEAGMTVVDVGSNIGYYAVQESLRAGSDGKVYCIEPNPSTHKVLLRNLSLNECHNAIPLRYAISDSSGHVEFFVSEKSNVSRILPREDYAKKVEVPAITLDELLAGESRVDLVRMDIEGHEIHALAGMLQTLKDHRPIVSIEFHFSVVTTDEAESFFESFRTLGYRIDCFVFRSSDELFFGRPLMRTDSMYRGVDIQHEFAQRMGSTNAVVFLVPEEKSLNGNLTILAREARRDLEGRASAESRF